MESARAFLATEAIVAIVASVDVVSGAVIGVDNDPNPDRAGDS